MNGKLSEPIINKQKGKAFDWLCLKNNYNNSTQIYSGIDDYKLFLTAN